MPLPLVRRQHTVFRTTTPRPQKSTTSRPNRKRPDWDDTVSDLSVYRASEDDLIQRKLLHQSSNSILVKEDKLQKRIKQVLKKNSLISNGVVKEAIHQDKGDKASTPALDNARDSSKKGHASSLRVVGLQANVHKGADKKNNYEDCVVRVLNDYDDDDDDQNEEEEDDDDDERDVASSKSDLEKVYSGMNIDMENRRKAEAEVGRLKDIQHNSEMEIMLLKTELINLKKEMQEQTRDSKEILATLKALLGPAAPASPPGLKQSEAVEPNFAERDAVGSTTRDHDFPSPGDRREVKKTELQRSAISLIPPKQSDSPLITENFEILNNKLDKARGGDGSAIQRRALIPNNGQNSGSASRETEKSLRLAELNRQRNEKLKELSRVLMMEVSAKQAAAAIQ